MKTREELLKEMNKFRRQMLDDKQSEIVKRGVQEILNAPTQKQLDCSFCHPEYPNMQYQGFKYCPHCVRKLGDE